MKNMYVGFIYITKNKINNKKYVGQHKQFKDNYLGSGTGLKNAIEKYGKENFEREIICYAKTLEELNSLEIKYIKKYNAVESSDFYNIAFGGSQINYWTGKQRDEKTKEKITAGLLKTYSDPKVRAKLSLINSGENNPRYGSKMSKEQKNTLLKINQIPIIVFKNNKIYGRYESATDFSIREFAGKNISSCTKMANGWIPTTQSKLFGFFIVKECAYNEFIKQGKSIAEIIKPPKKIKSSAHPKIIIVFRNGELLGEYISYKDFIKTFNLTEKDANNLYSTFIRIQIGGPRKRGKWTGLEIFYKKDYDELIKQGKPLDEILKYNI